MRLRAVTLFAAAACLSACANAARFLPPGFVKYEDRVQGVPVNPTIEAAARERRETVKSRFPVFAEQPQERPTRDSAATVAAEREELLTARDDLAASVAADRDSADAFRDEPLEKAARPERID